MTSKILAANWKLHKTRAEQQQFFDHLKTHGNGLKNPNLQLVIAPSPTLLERAAELAKPLGLAVFSQNVAYASSGAFTGEISVNQLVDLGVAGSIVGHSERRTLFGDTSETVAKRARCALEAGLQVMVCVGETHEERLSQQTLSVLKLQLDALWKELGPLNQAAAKLNRLLSIAYEPVWAIGTGLVAHPPQIAEAHEFIFKYFSALGLEPRLLYGGSVKPDNLPTIVKIPNVHGALVGGASLAPDQFLQLANCLSDL